MGRIPETESRGGKGGRDDKEESRDSPEDSPKETPKRVNIPPETVTGKEGETTRARVTWNRGGDRRDKEDHRAKRKNPEWVREKDRRERQLLRESAF